VLLVHHEQGNRKLDSLLVVRPFATIFRAKRASNKNENPAPLSDNSRRRTSQARPRTRKRVAKQRRVHQPAEEYRRTRHRAPLSLLLAPTFPACLYARHATRCTPTALSWKMRVISQDEAQNGPAAMVEMMPPNEQGMGPDSQAVCEAAISIAPEMVDHTVSDEFIRSDADTMTHSPVRPTLYSRQDYY